jgi:N-acetylglucosamine-6-sulfatase
VALADLNSWDFTVVPNGFDCPTCAWCANGGGDYYSPAFVTQNAGAGIPDCLGGRPGEQLGDSVTASCSPAGDFQFPMTNYTTAVVGNLSIEWITKVVESANGPPPPFFAYVAPKAAHEPFNPAPWYRDHWDASWPSTEPRPVSWNCSAASRKDHHGNIATEDMMTTQEATVVTGIFKNRWRALMSVDDVIAGVIGLCEDLGKILNRYESPGN